MQVIRKKIIVNSETITIPELSKFMGKAIEIILIEIEENKSKKNSKFINMAGEIDLDSQSVNKLREASKL
jgi:hypothetical protein